MNNETSENPIENRDSTMSLIDHLDELRNRVLRSALYLAIAFSIALLFANHVIVFLEKPATNIQFQALSLEEPLFVFFKVAFYIAIILASPLILFEITQFVLPGLKRNEKQILIPIIIGAPLLFLSGSAFAYYLVLPPMLSFFGNFGQSMAPIHQRLDFYISLVITVILYMGLCFQLPLILFALSFTDLISSKQMLSASRYAILGSAIVAAVVTPDPTVFSMLIVMAALVCLYFASVLLIRIFGH
jgi:sec-independent protein translocase protein TatC